MNRRTFVQTGAAAAAGAALLPSMAWGTGRKIGIQLYTLRDSITKDPHGVLKSVADIGFTDLETFGYREGKIFGMEFPEYGKYVGDLGMRTVSGHYGIGQVRAGWERALSDAREIGQEYVVVPSLPSDERTEDGYKKACADLNKGAELCKQYGLRMGYHNHDFEFKEVSGEPAFDLMLRELSPDVSIELDLFWIIYAGKRPEDYFAKYPGRFEQWHVKDMDKLDSKRNTPVGKGAIDYKALFAQAKLSGMRYFYLEHDNHSGVPLEGVKEGYAFLASFVK
jgi:sugar phosphate isomerase/epimerase